MANRRTHYLAQFVTAPDLNLSNDGLENADRAIMADSGLFGVASGCGVAQHSTGDLSVTIALGVGYDQSGQRCFVPSLQTLDVSVDSTATTTAVSGAGNSKIVSVFLQFLRVDSTPHPDGSVPPVTIQTVNSESFKFVVMQGAEAVSPSPPALLTNGILLADLTRSFGSSTILTANIGVTRRQDVFRSNGSPRSQTAGTAPAASAAMLGFYNAHVTGASDRHPAAALDYAGGGPWADASSFGAATVEAAIDAIVSRLASTSAGLDGSLAIGVKALSAISPLGSPAISAGTLLTILNIFRDAGNIGCSTLATFLDGTTLPGQNVTAQLNSILIKLADQIGVGADGAAVIGAEARSNVPRGSVGSQLSYLANAPSFFGAITAGDYHVPFALSLSSIQQAVITVNTTEDTSAFALSLPVNQFAVQQIKMADGQTMVAVDAVIHPNNGTPPSGGGVTTITVKKLDITNGTVTTLATTRSDPTTGASYGGFHVYSSNIFSEVIDNTTFIYWATLHGETSTGAAPVGVFPFRPATNTTVVPKGA